MRFAVAVQWTRKARITEFACRDFDEAFHLWHRVRSLGAFRASMFYRTNPVGARSQKPCDDPALSGNG